MAPRARADTSGRFPNRSIDRAASRKASGASGSRWRSRTRSTLIRTISSGIDDGSVATIRYPNRTTCSGSIRLMRIRANRSPTPGVSYSANAPMTAGWGRPPLDHGSADEVSTSPAVEAGSTAACRIAITPPMECPESTTLPVASSEMNRETIRRSSITPDPRPSRSDEPNPGRSIARTRPSPASPGATWSQFRCEPPRPWINTNVVSPGPSHARYRTGPSRSMVASSGRSRLTDESLPGGVRSPCAGKRGRRVEHLHAQERSRGRTPRRAIQEVAAAVGDLQGSTEPLPTGCHKTFTPRCLYICHQDALPYLRAAAKASFSARLHSGSLPELPSSRGPVRLLPATTRPRGGE